MCNAIFNNSEDTLLWLCAYDVSTPCAAAGNILILLYCISDDAAGIYFIRHFYLSSHAFKSNGLYRKSVLSSMYEHISPGQYSDLQ